MLYDEVVRDMVLRLPDVVLRVKYIPADKVFCSTVSSAVVHDSFHWVLPGTYICHLVFILEDLLCGLDFQWVFL